MELGDWRKALVLDEANSKVRELFFMARRPTSNFETKDFNEVRYTSLKVAQS